MLGNLSALATVEVVSIRPPRVSPEISPLRIRMDGVAALLLWCVVGLALWCVPTCSQEAAPKNLIYYGWGIRDTQYIREPWHEMKQMPFDGAGIIVAIDRQGWQQGKRAPDNQFGRHVMGSRAFRVEDLREAIDDLTAVKWRTFTDNFLPVGLSTVVSATGLNWFDDDRWRIVVNNFAVTANLASKFRAKYCGS